MRIPCCVRLAVSLTASILVSSGAALDVAEGTFVDAKTGINFTTYTPPLRADGNGYFTFGLALPENGGSQNVTEYIGLLRCQSISLPDKSGWCGIAHAGHMAMDLLLMIWPYQDTVISSFRIADGYFPPAVFNSTNATLSVISSTVNTTHYELIYRCRNCFKWTRAEGEYVEEVNTADKESPPLWGFAQGAQSVGNPWCPDQIVFGFHNNGYGEWQINVDNATKTGYGKWTELPSKTGTSPCLPAPPGAVIVTPEPDPEGVERRFI